MNDDLKKAIDEALNKWANDRVAAFGWAVIRYVGTAVLVLLVAVLIKYKGFSW